MQYSGADDIQRQSQPKVNFEKNYRHELDPWAPSVSGLFHLFYVADSILSPQVLA
jgi:hypothetical protein